ncbi:hypothetical protein FHP25_12400 [Vineibacter terrae]|uniref:Uncharacterized protein n=1 Tax=Vineibacter terrae TaxID=2586908 RepID=A0A5C8PNV7_9HYPH|nr:hypothetical protein [Vineibacter terrae]TXL76440.1 hypothetical protein FHP25_12400 [Vineibacter terrae]
MQNSFDFAIGEDWQKNIERLKAHLEAVDAECAKILFDNLTVLETGDNNARRDFNQKVLEALEVAAQADIDAAGDV